MPSTPASIQSTSRLGRRGEQGEQARRIGAVLVRDLVGRHHVAFRLRHLRAVADHHALREQLAHRFVVAS